jgi:hypothetical protein
VWTSTKRRHPKLLRFVFAPVNALLELSGMREIDLTVPPAPFEVREHRQRHVYANSEFHVMLDLCDMTKNRINPFFCSWYHLRHDTQPLFVYLNRPYHITYLHTRTGFSALSNVCNVSFSEVLNTYDQNRT